MTRGPRLAPTRVISSTLLVTTGLLATVLGLVHAQGTRTVRDGVYTNTQAARGEALYTKSCAGCHGSALNGGAAPPLVGDASLAFWRTQPVSLLADKIRHTMPPGAAGTLTPPQASDLVAHLLKAGGFPAGSTELSADADVSSRITWPQGATAPPATTAAAGKAYPPVGNVTQLMRGVFFPNSNLIFTVQTHDPGAPVAKRPPPDPDAGFSWVTWGNDLYSGWELVDYAAVTLADASPLMLVPGLRCQNGREAPIADREWIRYTEEMIAVSRKLYALSQTRNQEAVSDATGDLSDACANCHRAYLDVFPPGGRGRGGPNAGELTNTSGRCKPRK